MNSKFFNTRRWKLSFIILMINVYQKRYHISFALIMAGYVIMLLNRPKTNRRKQVGSLKSHTVIVTGATGDIGKNVVKEFADRGARIIMACRDLKKGQRVADGIRTSVAAASIEVEHLDLADLNSVTTFCNTILEKEPQINILINNAGVMMVPKGETKDSFELHFGVNHLGHFLLTMSLLERIKRSAPGRIINVSSIAHTEGRIHWEDVNMDKNYDPFTAYCQSKLANVLFTKELAKHLKGTGIQVFAVHPGIVDAKLHNHFRSGLWLDLWKGNRMVASAEAAKYIVRCALNKELNDKNGLYFSKATETLPSFRARNENEAKQLWQFSSALVGLQ